MESILDTKWDVVISGTGLAQSLLALALSRSDKKVLHVDLNEYYGGADAALSLDDAADWAKRVVEGEALPVFDKALISKTTADEKEGHEAKRLAFSRAYSLALAPQIIYMNSAFQAVLVSSKMFRQLQFMAVGNWFVFEAASTSDDGSASPCSLKKIPSSREDVFADKSMSMKVKRSLITFQRLFRDPGEQSSIIDGHGTESLEGFLKEQYSLPVSIREAINALTLSPNPPSRTLVKYAIPRISRHITSLGASGAGFGAIIPKWGGLSEITQVACRAQAVGGGIYMLGKGVTNVSPPMNDEVKVTLTGDEEVKTRFIVGATHEVGQGERPGLNDNSIGSSRSISLVSFAFDELFAKIVTEGPQPAAAVACFPAGSIGDQDQRSQNPVYLMIHSADSGECPSGQCVVYGSMLKSEHSQRHLDMAVRALLQVYHKTSEEILWTMTFERYQSIQLAAPGNGSGETDPCRLGLNGSSLDLAFDDSILQEVRGAWQSITGEIEEFMRFEDREVGAYDDEDVDNTTDG